MMDIFNELYKMSCRDLGLQCISWLLTLPSDLSRALTTARHTRHDIQPQTYSSFCVPSLRG